MSGWLPHDFTAPARLDLPTGHHLRQIRADDVDLDYPAVMGSQPRLWSIFGRAWGWPPSDMTYENDREDLRRHAEEMTRNESFNYAVFDRDETRLLGCVYLDPPERVGADADISWWVVDSEIGGPLDRALDRVVPEWVASRWPFERPRFVGRDLTWDEWLALPEPPSEDHRVSAFWDRFRAAVPAHADEGGPRAVEPFGDSVELADELIALVVDGPKRATAGAVVDYEQAGEPLPRVGDLWVATDGRGRPRAVLHTTEVRVGPLSSVDDAFAWDEGEGDRTRRDWLAAHERFFRRYLPTIGETFSPEMPTVFERFDVLYSE